ncbi:hypothetical protein [Fontibacter flavus]|uniref:N-acetyltransferase domain-containing protein n=1 Tax=Fontibacter flavus TaxID=654838 RepID=A0ABV6FUT0_9BACT|nr:hypothetical protein [Cyclobacteriaceae bacterium]
MPEKNYISLDYSFKSELGDIQERRYIQEVLLTINLMDENGGKVEKIGHAVFFVLHIDHAIDDNYPIFQVLDGYSEYLSRHLLEIIDLDMEEFAEDIQEYYQSSFYNTNVCVIQELSIFPKFRGYDLGAKAIKDIIFHFGKSFGLCVLQPHPIQFDPALEMKLDIEKMGIVDLEKDEALAFEKLRNYYLRMGFEAIEGFEEVLFFNPIFQNDAIDQISLDEDPF